MRRIATVLCAAGALAAFALPGSASAAFGPVGFFGSPGAGNGQLNGPHAIAVTGASAYVADTGNSRVESFDTSGHFQGFLGGAPPFPTDIAAVGNNIAVAGGGQVTRWLAGIGIGTVTPPGTSYGVAIDPLGNMWVSDSQNGLIYKYDGLGNKQPVTLGSPGTGPGQLALAQGLTSDSAGNIYVADAGNHKVVKYAPGGGFQEFAMPTYTIVANGNTITGRIEPHDVAVDGAGRVYAPDANPASNLVAVFGPGGDLQQLFGSPISDPGSPCALSSPRGVSSAPSGALYVASTGESRIKVFSESAGSCPAPDFGTNPAAGGEGANGGTQGKNGKGKKGKGQPSIKLVGFPHHCARKNFQFEIRLDDDVEIRVMDLFVNGRKVARQKPGQTSWSVKVKMPVTNVRRQLPKGARVKVTVEVKAKDASGRKNGLARAFKICG